MDPLPPAVDHQGYETVAVAAGESFSCSARGITWDVI